MAISIKLIKNNVCGYVSRNIFHALNYDVIFHGIMLNTSKLNTQILSIPLQTILNAYISVLKVFTVFTNHINRLFHGVPNSEGRFVLRFVD